MWHGSGGAPRAAQSPLVSLGDRIEGPEPAETLRARELNHLCIFHSADEYGKIYSHENDYCGYGEKVDCHSIVVRNKNK